MFRLLNRQKKRPLIKLKEKKKYEPCPGPVQTDHAFFHENNRDTCNFILLRMDFFSSINTFLVTCGRQSNDVFANSLNAALITLCQSKG